MGEQTMQSFTGHSKEFGILKALRIQSGVYRKYNLIAIWDGSLVSTQRLDYRGCVPRGETWEVDMGAQEGCYYACLGVMVPRTRVQRGGGGCWGGGYDRVRKEGLRMSLRDLIFKSW